MASEAQEYNYSANSPIGFFKNAPATNQNTIQKSRQHFYEAFEANAANPEIQNRPAILLQDQTFLTYQELNHRVNRLAHYLRDMNELYAGDSRIGLFFHQSAEYVISVLAIMKAGLTFIPLTANTKEVPIARLLKYAKESKVNLILSYSKLKKEMFLASEQIKEIKQILIDEISTDLAYYPETNPNVDVSFNQLAYILNTSGATGIPKQVLIEHTGLFNCMRYSIDFLKITPGDKFAGFSSIAFDASLFEFMVALGAGACFYPISPEIRNDNKKLKHLYQKYGISVSIFSPSMLRNLKKGDFPTLRTLISTGEKITPEIVKAWCTSDGLEVVDGYGPTECPIAAWMTILNPQGKIHAGTTPITGLRIFVLEKNPEFPDAPKRVDIGVEGELYIASEGLARGYSDEKLTAQRFRMIQDPDNPNNTIRVFQTRDAVKLLENGQIEIVGRLDRQIKINSKLICPEEIESVLLQCSEINNVYAGVKDKNSNHPKIIVFLETKSNTQPINLHVLYDKIATHLIPEMIPAGWVVVDKILLNQSGKPDANELFEQYKTITRIQGTSGIKVTTDLELSSSKLWKTILDIEDESFISNVDDDFRELGGTSVQITELLEALRNKHQLKLTATEFLQSPTIATLARRIQSIKNEAPEINEAILLNPEQADKQMIPLFLLPSLLGNAEQDYAKLVEGWRSNRPIYGFNARGLNDPADMDENLEVMAADYWRSIRKIIGNQSTPILVGGWSAGGVLTSVITGLLREKGKDVGAFMIDSEAPFTYQTKNSAEFAAFLLRLFNDKLAARLHLTTNEITKAELTHLSPEQQIYYLFNKLVAQCNKREGDNDKIDVNLGFITTVKNMLLAILRYKQETLVEDVMLFAADKTQENCRSECLGWPKHLISFGHIISLSGNHESIVLDNESSKKLAEEIENNCIKNIGRFETKGIAKQLRAKKRIDLDEEELPYYIPLNGCWNNNYKVSFDLKKEVDNFLTDKNKKVLLLLGPSGAGKSLFCQYLTDDLSKRYENEGPIVLYIPLANFSDPLHGLIEEKLKLEGLSTKQINHLKENKHPFVFIPDGYDEIKTDYQNLYATNRLSEWNAKVIITCRSSYLMNAPNYKSYFVPIYGSKKDFKAFEEITLVPFSDNEIKSYIKKYIDIIKEKEKNYPDDEKTELWKETEYIQYINKLPGLKTLITTPFLLRILMDVLPTIVKEYEQTPFDKQMPLSVIRLYDYFVDRWFERQETKLILNSELPEYDYKEACYRYARELATKMWELDVTQIVYRPSPHFSFIQNQEEKNPWDVFFSNRDPDTKKIREGCPLKPIPTEPGSPVERWGFIHDSLKQYFFAEKTFEEALRNDLKAVTMATLGSSNSTASFLNQNQAEQSEEQKELEKALLMSLQQ